MRFVCGACGETIKLVNSPKHHASFVPHSMPDGESGCGYETFFPTHVATPKNQNPTPTRVRRIGDESDGVAVKDFRREPSAADLDAVSEEKRVEAVAYIVSQGYEQEEAEKIVAESGVEKVLAAKAEDDEREAVEAKKLYMAKREHLAGRLVEVGVAKEAAEHLAFKFEDVDAALALSPDVLKVSANRILDGDKTQDAVAYLVSIGKSQEEAVKLIDEVGVERILKSKRNAEAKAEKKAEREAKKVGTAK